jgi:hypothetical protein
MTRTEPGSNELYGPGRYMPVLDATTWRATIQMIFKRWIWKPVVAGLAGTIVHFSFMYLKSRIGLLPSFQPYHSFQIALSQWIGRNF